MSLFCRNCVQRYVHDGSLSKNKLQGEKLDLENKLRIFETSLKRNGDYRKVVHYVNKKNKYQQNIPNSLMLSFVLSQLFRGVRFTALSS